MNFIFVNNVKRHICDVQSSRLRRDLPILVNDIVILLFPEGLIFTKLLCENKTLSKISEFTVGVSNTFVFISHAHTIF